MSLIVGKRKPLGENTLSNLASSTSSPKKKRRGDTGKAIHLAISTLTNKENISSNVRSTERAQKGRQPSDSSHGAAIKISAADVESKDVEMTDAKAESKKDHKEEFGFGLENIYDRVLAPNKSLFSMEMLKKIHYAALNSFKFNRNNPDLSSSTVVFLCNKEDYRKWDPKFGDLPPSYMFLKKYEGNLIQSTFINLRDNSVVVEGSFKEFKPNFELTHEISVDDLEDPNFIEKANDNTGKPKGRVVGRSVQKDLSYDPSFEREILVLDRLRLIPGVCQYIDECIDAETQKRVIFTEYCNQSEVSSFFTRLKEAPRARLLPIVCRDILKGIFAIHSTHHIHGDIKSANILIKYIKKFPFVKFNDFGSARRIDEESLEGASYPSPERWEAIGWNYASSYADDIWATGHAIFQIINPDKTFALIQLRIFHSSLRAFYGKVMKAIEEDPESLGNNRDEYFAELTSSIESLDLNEFVDFTNFEAYKALRKIDPRETISHMEKELLSANVPCEDTLREMEKTIQAYVLKIKEFDVVMTKWIEKNKGKKPLEGQHIYQELLMDMMHPDPKVRLNAKQLVLKYEQPLSKLAEEQKVKD